MPFSRYTFCLIEQDLDSSFNNFVYLHSSWFGVYTYFGFFADWVTQAASSVLIYPLIISTIASFFVGVCLYVEGMVKDLKKTLMAFHKSNEDQSEMWSIYVNEIRFHNEIIE